MRAAATGSSHSETFSTEETNDELLVTGIKVRVDGSTKGVPQRSSNPMTCTANAPPPARLWRTPQTSCSLRTTNELLIANMKPFWKAGWPIQMRVNGDRVILNALNALAALQAEARNDSPIVLVHFTVGGNPATQEDLVRMVAVRVLFMRDYGHIFQVTIENNLDGFAGGGVAALRDALARGEIRFHAGSIRGAFPQII